jgi:hypothetical protein
LREGNRYFRAFCAVSSDRFRRTLPSQICNLVNVPTANQTRLDAYLAAEVKILTGQSVTIDGRSLTRADLSVVTKQIAVLQTAVNQELAAAAGRGGRFSQADFSR